MAKILSLVSLLVTLVGVQGITCPNFFEGVGEYCYLFSEDTGDLKNWDDARSYCQLLDSDLAIFDIPCGDSILFRNFIAERGYQGMWVGATDSAQEGLWTWINGHLIDVKSNLWHQDHPRTSTSRNCAIFRDNDPDIFNRPALQEEICSDVTYFVCQYGTHARL